LESGGIAVLERPRHTDDAASRHVAVTYFDAIMHKFIFKFGDVDRPMIEDICESLLEYYGFLAQAKLVSTDEFERFQTTLRSRQQGLLEKMERYNEIRHDDDVDEEEKEAIREELFEGDHTWPHL